MYLDFLYLVNTDKAFPEKRDLENNLEAIDLYKLPEYCRKNNNKIIWLYEEVIIEDTTNYENVLCLNISDVGDAFQVYWDNKLIGFRASIGSTHQEEANTYIQLITIPYEYASVGKHTLLIKAYSNRETNYTGRSFVLAGYNQYLNGIIKKNYVPIVTYSILFVSAIFFFVLFFGIRKYEYLFISIACLAFGLRAYARDLWFVEDFGVAVRSGNPELSDIMLPVAFFSLHCYLLSRLSLFQKYKYQSAFVLLSVVSVLFLRQFDYMRVSIVISVLITCFGIYKKDYSSIFILIGLIGFWILSKYADSPMEKGLIDYPGPLFLIVIIIILSSMEISRNNKKHRESILKASRLENELLKRNIQPHFILNTLTALQEVVEKYPEKASSLIEALADEFRLFSKVAGEKLINIKDELNICDAHLRIMEYRKGVNFSLTTEGITGDETIPPGIFHTIVENGTTHGFSELKTGNFLFNKIVEANCVKYILFNNGRSEVENSQIKKGTGFKYIEARLEESFPGKWNLDYKPVPDGWEVVITICERNGSK